MSRLRWLAVAVAAGLTFSALPPTTAAAAGEFAGTVPDDAYRACITGKLGLATDADPTTEQLASITELSCTGKGITDVTGTSALPNLTKLFLDNNQLTDITPLASSTTLFSVGLENNQLSNIGPLASLTELRAVKLAKNRIRDFSALSTLPKYDRYSGTFNNQAITLQATKDVPAVVPTIVGDKGEAVSYTTVPSGITKVGNVVTYPATGDYVWQFKNDSLYLNGTVTVSVADDGVTVPDDALRACFLSRLGKSATPEYQPTAAELAGLAGALSCANKGVKDLTGLNLATGLGTLTLNGNYISDLTPISALTGITSANLAMNEYTSLVALGALPALKTIQVQQSASSTKQKLVTLAGAEKLGAVTSITANHTAVNSLQPLAGHQTLATLDATNNRITSVSPLATVGSQLKNVTLDGNQISDLSPLASNSYTKLHVRTQKLTAPEATAEQETAAPAVIKKDGSTLVATPPTGVTAGDGKVTYAAAGSYAWSFSFVDNLIGVQFSGTITQPVKDAPPPPIGVDIPDPGFRACLAAALAQDATAPISSEQLASLASLTCVGKSIADLTGAEHLTGLSELILSTNQISEVSKLAGLTSLTKLWLAGNAIADPAPLAALTGLQDLNLSYNPIASLSTLRPLVDLTDLNVAQRDTSTTRLTSLDGVQGMTKLRSLNANNNALTDLAPLSDLTALTNIAVLGNAIGGLTPLQNLTGLKKLQADYNRISDVTPLAGLTELTDLALRNNRIGDLSALSQLTKLGYQSLNVQRQTVTAASVPALYTTSVPLPRTNTGELATVTAPEGIAVADGKVRYPNEGSYQWTFTATDEESSTEFFTGTITQPVTAPVSGAAEVPDPALRRCLSQAAGLTTDAVLTEADVAAITTVDCSNRSIADLTGAELLSSATTLKLAGNPLTSIADLSGLTNLKNLDLSSTGLASVASLSELAELVELRVDGNQLSDLSPLGGLAGLTAVSATGQSLKLADTPGGVEVPVPTVTNRAGVKVAAQLPAEATKIGDKATFARAGSYSWPFSDDTFSGAFAQRVTTDVVDPPDQIHAAAAACVTAGKVWVVVERDTGLQAGGCAAEFGTGLKALQSAGFQSAGTALVTAIDGYPSKTSDGAYWSYWHADRPVTSGSSLTYGWTYSSVGANQHKPKAGSVEGWRYVSLSGPATSPTWTLTMPVPSTPTPTPTPSPSVSTTLTVRAASLRYGKKVTVPVTVSPAQTVGIVAAKVGAKTVKARIVNGKATLTLPARSLKPGTHTLTVSFAKQGAYQASSTQLKLSVAKAVPKVKVKVVSLKKSRAATLKITVSASGTTPTGKVKVTLAGRSKTVKLNSKGQATVTLTKLKKTGKQKAKASYAGSSYVAKKSATIKVKVKR